MSAISGVPFIGTYAPVGLAVLVVVGMAAAAKVALSAMQQRSRPKSFDVGGPFDQNFKRVWPDLRKGFVWLVYAGYGTLWLTSWPADAQLPWWYLPWDSPGFGLFCVVVVGGLWLGAAMKLCLAGWYGWRWLRLEAQGMRWHTADSGEVYRIIWLRPTGEYLFDTTIRDHRLQQELQAIRTRKQRLITATSKAATAIGIWLGLPVIVANLYHLVTPETYFFIAKWEAPIFDWVMLLFAVVPSAADLATAIADELVYRSGAQFITGAKVLGTRAVVPTRKDVEAQKAHGDADFVPAAEAVQRMAGPPQL